MTGLPAVAWAAVVVNHNAGDALTACVESVAREGASEVVVVDNASTDGSLAALERSGVAADVVRTGTNGGYATAANVGISRTTADVVAVLNPDTVLHPGCATHVLARFDEPDVAAVGPRIHGPDGSVYPSARRVPSAVDALGHAFLGLALPRNRFTSRYRELDADPDRPRDVDWVSGSAVWLRRTALDEVGGWDGRYFMYLEDVDLCWRLGRAGWRTVYEPGGIVTHEQGRSTRRRPYRMLAAHHRSMLRFATRRWRGWRRVFLVPLVPVLALRALVTMALHAVRSVTTTVSGSASRRRA